MRVFRIAKTRYIDDLSGTGPRLHGGRWNNKGTSLIYTSSSRSLATVEYLVHVPIAIVPKNLRIATIEIPAGIVPIEIETADLPDSWRQYPPPPGLADMGSNWALSGESLLLRVPSAVIENENNILINPTHPDMRRVEIVDVQSYSFDDRLIR